jgi:hypothetical protein
MANQPVAIASELSHHKLKFTSYTILRLSETTARMWYLEAIDPRARKD